MDRDLDRLVIYSLLLARFANNDAAFSMCWYMKLSGSEHKRSH